MGIVDDVFRALDRIPVWKRLQELPSEVDELKARVAELEQKLGGKWPAEVCRHCGERQARIALSRLQGSVIMERYDCAACGEMDFRYRKPA